MKESEEFLTLSEAAKLLGISRVKMSRLVAAGALVTSPDPLDDRVKLVRREDVLALVVRRKAA